MRPEGAINWAATRIRLLHNGSRNSARNRVEVDCRAALGGGAALDVPGSGAMRRVYPDRCVGHGPCYRLAPDIFDSDEVGHSIVRIPEVSEDQEQHQE